MANPISICMERAFCLLVWAAVKTRDMQANPCHVKTLFLLKKCRHGGFSGERERESQRECIESCTARCQEVGVRFRGSGKVVEVHKEDFCCFRPYMRALNPIFTHSATFCLYCGSRMGRHYRAKWGFSMVHYLHVRAGKESNAFQSTGPFWMWQVAFTSSLPVAEPSLHEYYTAQCVFSQHSFFEAWPLQETLMLKWSQSKDNQTKNMVMGINVITSLFSLKKKKKFIQ